MTALLTSRRSLIGGMVAAMAAPSIVRASNMMPVSARRIVLYVQTGASNYVPPPDARSGFWIETSNDGEAWEPLCPCDYRGRVSPQ